MPLAIHIASRRFPIKMVMRAGRQSVPGRLCRGRFDQRHDAPAPPPHQAFVADLFLQWKAHNQHPHCFPVSFRPVRADNTLHGPNSIGLASGPLAPVNRELAVIWACRNPVSLRHPGGGWGCRACSAPARLPQASMVETGGPGRSPRLLWEQAEGTTIASLGHLDPAGCGYSHTVPRQPAIASNNASAATACLTAGEARRPRDIHAIGRGTHGGQTRRAGPAQTGLASYEPFLDLYFYFWCRPSASLYLWDSSGPLRRGH